MTPTTYRIDPVSPFNAAGTAPLSKSVDRRASNGASRSTSAIKAPTNSDRAAERAFYRRILFQDLSASTDAPTITHDVDLDHEIYLLLAYLLRETVLPWYGKLTPDREFLTQITSIIVSIIHTIVERQTASDGEFESDINAPYTSRNAELPRIHDLLSRDIPLILRQHCSDFRQAHSKAGSAWAPLGTPSSSSIPPGLTSQSEQDDYRRQQVHEQLPFEHQQVLALSTSAAALPPPLTLAQHFIAASPHPGLERTTGALDGKIDPVYLRIATLHLLSSLLPADEYAPDTEKFIVRDVLVTVLRGALARSFRPWFFVQSVHKVLDAAGWAKQPSPPAVSSDNDDSNRSSDAERQGNTMDAAVSIVVGLLTRLPGILLQLWSLVAFTVLPFLVRTYLDLFNVQRARKKRTHHQRHRSQQDDLGSLKRSSNVRSTFPSSMSTGSLIERTMHGRYPSRKFQLSQEEIAQMQGHSTAIDTDFAHTHIHLTNGRGENTGDDTAIDGQQTADEPELPPDYVGHWLDAMEEVLEVDSRLLLRTIFGLVRTIMGTTGLGESVNRMAVRRINAELKDTAKLARMVRELRGILLPNGHLPPSVPDPDVETQEAEWIRLRLRLACAGKTQETLLTGVLKKMLLGSADSGFRRGDSEARLRDAQIQVQRLTTWLAPFCSPQAAGPNTLLAILLFERVVVAICPDLTMV